MNAFIRLDVLKIKKGAKSALRVFVSAEIRTEQKLYLKAAYRRKQVCADCFAIYENN